MVNTQELTVIRWNGDHNQEPRPQTYSVPREDKATILAALLYLREHQDPSLAFRFGCRFERCGLCGVAVNGRPRLACRTYLRPGQVISPLPGLPVVRDLVVDRTALWQRLNEERLFIPSQPAGPPAQINEPATRRRLGRCMDCLVCQAACSHHGEEGFAGPWLFVRLAVLHLDPRDQEDRVAQAHRWGVEKCASCRRCYCPGGVAIYRDAIATLLGVEDN